MAHRAQWPIAIIAIHWLTAITVVSLFGVGLWMVDLNYYSEWYRTAPHWHRSVGLLLAALTLARVVVRLSTSRPEALGKPWEVRAAHTAHLLLYLLLTTMFVSGYLISTADGREIAVFNWFAVPGLGEFIDNQEDVAGDIHFYSAWSLIVLAAVHAVASIKHHVIDKDRTLVAMIRKG